jgi:CubicO group peptidase (beta-lactamase class C family)
MFMADIIERVSGETFADWMLENVLLALGMIHTYVEDDYSRVVPSNATSYYDSNDSDFSRAVEFWGYVGSGNIHSTTGDLLNWLSCYYHPPTGWEDAFELMQTRGILNKGDTLSYAFGVMVDEYKTHRRLQHGGAIGGYRSMAQAFPDEELNLVLLTNFSSSDVGSKIGRMADLMLGIESEAEEGGLIMEASIRTIPLPAGELEKYSAYFWSHEANHSRKIYLKEDTLRYFRSESSESKLLPVGKDTFQMIDVPSRVMVSFELIGNQPIAMIVQVEDFATDLLEAYLPPEIQGDRLQYYTGKYFSSELDTYYSISVQGDTLLMANHVRHGDFEIKVLREDILEADYPLRSIRVERDKRGRISGFYVSNGRVRNLWFEKQ